jgi:oligoribonuclease NrnB/cAMP/cGMP phosphodiesterase (DHH superfamily)
MTRFVPGPKTALVTHKGCLDGTGSALMFLLAGGSRENILFRVPNQCDLTPAETVDFDEVWFADLCPSNMRDPAGGKPFHVFDHHLSNKRKFGDDPHCTFSMAHSGTSLMARELGLDQTENFQLANDLFALVPALEAYDLGRFDHQEGMFLADIAASLSQEEMLDVLYADRGDIFTDAAFIGRAAGLAASRRLYAAQAAKNKRIRKLDEYLVGVVVSPVYWKNEVATKVLEDETVDIAMVIDPSSGMVSLRSRANGPDCSMIAGRYGGGGHPKAAGFPFRAETMLDSLFETVVG